jgi:hypothetical protein
MATFHSIHLPDSSGQSQVNKVFTSFIATNNLRTQASYPNHCPQLVTVRVGSAGAGNLVYKDFAGNTNTIALGNSEVHHIEGATSTIEISTFTGTVIAYWWCDGATVTNP